MTASFAAVSQLADALGHVPVVVGVLTKGSLLIVLAVCLTRALGRAPAAARHLVWSLSVAALLLLPATSWIPWRLELPVLGTARDALGVSSAQPSAPVTSTADLPADKLASDAPPLRSDTPPLETDASPPRLTNVPASASPGFVAALIDRMGTPATLLIALWLAGSLWMLGRLAIGVASVRSMIRRSEPATDDGWDEILERARRSIGGGTIARTVISENAAMPFTYGLFRPTIVLPAAAEEWTADRRRSVLLHELAHVRRHDLITNAIVQVACAVYWFHPLVWLAARRVRIEAERACDALVVGTGTLPSEYAGDLLEIARTMRSSATSAVALAMARRSDFEGRLLAILAPNAGRNALTAARAVLIALSFAAPAAAVAAAVPPSAVTPNAVVGEAVNAETEESSSLAASQKRPDVAAQAPEAPVAALPPAPVSGSASTTQGRDAAVPGLISVLKDENVAVRLASVEALEQLQDPRAIDALIDVMKSDGDARVREAAASALGSIDSPRAVPGLIAALGSERVGAVRAKIAWALGEIDDPRAVDALTAALKDQVSDVRHQAVWALGEIESAEAVPALIPILRDSDVEMRKQAAWALGEIENADAIPALSAATKDSDAEVREQAVWALGQIESVKALPALVAALSDDVVEVRRKAVEAIGDIDDLRTAPPGLIAALKDTDAEVRQNAAEALGNLEDKAAVPGLIPLTRDANPDVKRSAVEALSNIGGEAAIEAIVVLLKDSDPEIRKIAAEALGKNR
jgi:HEAT repeat protein/beta-lactamase regulating signal transducer with metallopeptidase domain